MDLLIATYNAGKIREIEEALRGLPITPRYLTDFPNAFLVEETGKTYEENAVLKAVGYSRQTGLYSLADDSGLEVDALDGKPGLLSARFGGENASDIDRTNKLLQALSAYQSERAAQFVCCIALSGVPPNASGLSPIAGKVLNISRGICEGTIAPEPRGTGGFGYDPVFIPAGYDSTFGELSPEIKAKLSHRAKALSAMRSFLREFLKAT
ncbi:MAG TPA: RdgB/HAM1 family non-canonical purine NTP pyrophosphatase [Pyrinomonadaceae bacterium]|nr:RdgB/HAM1 family non-canonical purine NTP pyrophosphatase [Pyrinomonadaceae bacterium]